MRGWSRYTRLSAVLTLAGACVLTSPAVAEHSAAWILRGSSSGFAEVTVTGGPYTLTPGDIHISGGRTYAGVAIEPVGPHGAAALVVKMRGREHYGLVRLEPGRYRLTLVTDGRARVEVPNLGGGDDEELELRPTTARVSTGSMVVAQGMSVASVRLAKAIPATFRAILVGTLGARGAGRADLCAAGPGQRCPADSGFTGAYTYFSARIAPAGAVRDALFEVDGVYATEGAAHLLAVAISR